MIMVPIDGEVLLTGGKFIQILAYSLKEQCGKVNIIVQLDACILNQNGEWLPKFKKTVVQINPNKFIKRSFGSNKVP